MSTTETERPSLEVTCVGWRLNSKDALMQGWQFPDGEVHFWGKGGLMVPSFLYDKDGNLVGVENANILTQHNQALATTCAEPGGFTGPADFSSTVVLF